MGVIIKQSIKNTFYSYLGAVIAFVNTALLISKYLTEEEFGITQYIFAVVLLFSSLLGMGFGSVTGRLFPYFRDKEKVHNGFLSLGLIVTTVGSLLAVILYYLFAKSYFLGSEEVFKIQYGFFVLPIVISTLFYNLFDTFLRMNYNTSIGVFMREVVGKLGVTLCLGLFIFEYISFEQFVWLYFIAYAIPTPILLIKIILDGDFVLVKPRPYLVKKLKNTMIRIAVFGLITGLSTIAVLQIDRLMIDKMIDVGAVGVYSMGFYFATLILLPVRSVKRISISVLADAWKNKDMQMIDTVYRKSSITLLIIGLYIFVGIWANIDNILTIIGDNYIESQYVIFLIGLANMITMISGVNLEIITTSRKYAYGSVFMIITFILIVVTNLIFIPIWGLIGAATASLISTFIFALLRYLLVLKSFKLQPFNYKHLLVILIGFVSYGAAYFLPTLENAYLDIGIKGTVISVVFFALVYLSKASEDINQKMEEAFRLVFVRKNRLANTQ